MEKRNTRSRPFSTTDCMDAENSSNTSLSGKDTHTATIRGNHQRTCMRTTWLTAIINGAHYRIKGNLGQPLEPSHPGMPLPTHSSFYLRSKPLVPYPLQIIPPLRCWEHVQSQHQLLRHLPTQRFAS